MGLLIDRINVREKAKYEQNTIKVLNNVVKPITTREYLVPNNAKSSAVYFCQNFLLIPPVRDGHTFPLTFIPSDNQNIIVKARFSHHASGPLDNWTKYEAMGSPNKRVDIYFFGADDSDDPNGDVEGHVISNKHLYSDSDVKLLQQALANFFKSGNFVNPFCENNENNNTKQINCNTNMNKKLIRLTESDLHRIVKESVQKILNEVRYLDVDFPDNIRSYHGNNPNDWGALADERYRRGLDAKKEYEYYDIPQNAIYSDHIPECPDWWYDRMQRDMDKEYRNAERNLKHSQDLERRRQHNG